MLKEISDKKYDTYTVIDPIRAPKTNLKTEG